MELRTSTGSMKNVTKGVHIEIELERNDQDYSDDYQETVEQPSLFSYPADQEINAEIGKNEDLGSYV